MEIMTWTMNDHKMKTICQQRVRNGAFSINLEKYFELHLCIERSKLLGKWRILIIIM